MVNVHSTSCTAVCHVLLGYIVRPEKHLKNEQRSRDAAAKKELIQVEYGKIIIIVRISIYLLTTTHTSHTYTL